MNKHIQTMKNALNNYQRSVKAGLEKMEENTRLYKPEEAEKANAAIMAQLKEAKTTVTDQIAEAQTAGQHDIDAWGKLDGSKITDDARLLEHGAVNPEQFRTLVEKYQDNSTMLQLLANYADKQNEGSGGFSAVWNYGGKGNDARSRQHFDTTGLPTVEAKQTAFDHAAASAFSIADRIGSFEKGKIGTGPDSPLILSALEHFGENTVI